MKNLKNFLIAFSLVALTACSDSDDDTNLINDRDLSEVNDSLVEEITSIELPSNLTSSSNTGAQQTVAIFGTFQALGTSFTSLFAIPSNAVEQRTNLASRNSNASNSQTYTWSDGITTVNYNITELVDRFTFVYNVEGPEFNGKFMDGYNLKDGSLAEFNIYDTENGGVALNFRLSVTETSVTCEFTDNQGSRFVLVSNSDNSGSLEIFENNTLTIKSSWNANGNGTLTDFSTGETFTW
ncbi:hypothetical protein [Tenacibaculum jejuense]|uniref:Probable lipoprotein n=1 Tax=Tenacibaculum jejuense TaxID=584609 RepID=A0A238U9I2_9FLAO|nr:hypothetical protein [Tenacibaculum jejuense]SNR15070.1 Probable lipoprotein precursor [Tenacibaculum jejuense]